MLYPPPPPTEQFSEPSTNFNKLHFGVKLLKIEFMKMRNWVEILIFMWKFLIIYLFWCLEECLDEFYAYLHVHLSIHEHDTSVFLNNVEEKKIQNVSFNCPYQQKKHLSKYTSNIKSLFNVLCILFPLTCKAIEINFSISQ